MVAGWFGWVGFNFYESGAKRMLLPELVGEMEGNMEGRCARGEIYWMC